MSRKEILDTFFKLCFVVIAIGVILILYNNSQINRYRYVKDQTVFDTCTGKSYAFATSDEIKSQGWVIYTPGKAPQIIGYTLGKNPVKIRDDTTGKDQVGRFVIEDAAPSPAPPREGQPR